MIQIVECRPNLRSIRQFLGLRKRGNGDDRGGVGMLGAIYATRRCRLLVV